MAVTSRNSSATMETASGKHRDLRIYTIYRSLTPYRSISKAVWQHVAGGERGRSFLHTTSYHIIPHHTYIKPSPSRRVSLGEFLLLNEVIGDYRRSLPCLVCFTLVHCLLWASTGDNKTLDCECVCPQTCVASHKSLKTSVSQARHEDHTFSPT